MNYLFKFKILLEIYKAQLLLLKLVSIINTWNTPILNCTLQTRSFIVALFYEGRVKNIQSVKNEVHPVQTHPRDPECGLAPIWRDPLITFCDFEIGDDVRQNLDSLSPLPHSWLQNPDKPTLILFKCQEFQ